MKPKILATPSRVDGVDMQAAIAAAMAATIAVANTQPVPIHIVCTRDGFRVTAFTQVKRGFRVEIINHTKGDVTIQFPHRHLFGVSGMHIPAGESRLLVVQSHVFVGTYTYSVFCHEGNEFAEGNSMPIIIVDPDEDEAEASET